MPTVPVCPHCEDPLVLRWKRGKTAEPEPAITCSACGRALGDVLDWIPGDPPPVPVE